MHAMSLQQLATDVGGKCRGENVCFDAISTDTRTLKEGELFVALSGENYNANDFVEVAKQKGAIAALMSQDSEIELPTVVVSDALQALTTMAKNERKKSAVSLVAITGSNGKTTVKEMLRSIFAESKKVLATEGNLNNHIGVPLTLLKLTGEHQVAVVEMGASHRGEISQLCEIAKPDVAVLNNVGAAHLEGFGSLQGVAEAKGEIVSGLNDAGIAVLNLTEPWFEYWNGLAGGTRVMSFGWTSEADVWADEATIISELIAGEFKTTFMLHYQKKAAQISLNLVGAHNILNAAAAATAAFAMGVSMQQVADGLGLMQPVKGRLQPLAGLNQSVIIHDGYNANPKSFEAALNCVLSLEIPIWLVLGDFSELGDAAESIHQQLGQDIANSGVERLYATGRFMKHTVKSASAGIQAKHFAEKSALITELSKALVKGVVVLVKGSRSQGLEDIVDQLINKGDVACC
ncbi:MAG: UDP-N-acetylmuramoyl-tripeptide--D-alanyl-D-alanine ligase [Cycloclasticus sp. symbiont of Poecilosclerida sp. M]|nr:MAG: UDP-N-acetylmuramoyl-tripeptide--D-alanyl-D-alanine ligase [Cycloclasticus sp. symbiont of Poecilosclerida sp. M]